MTEIQEAAWYYAKGLELAIMLKGAVKKKLTEDTVINHIEKEYDDIAGRIAGEIHNKAKTMITKKML